MYSCPNFFEVSVSNEIGYNNNNYNNNNNNNKTAFDIAPNAKSPYALYTKLQSTKLNTTHSNLT